MPFDNEKFSAPATASDVGGVAINCVIALDAVVVALKALRDGEDPTESIDTLEEASRDLHKFFVKLTGWIPPA
jgi:hypothetical protein